MIKKISPKRIYIFLIKLKNLLIRKDQKYFFQIEKFSKQIKVANRNFILLNNYIFEFNNFIKKRINLKNIKKLIFIVHSKDNNFFEYKLDKKIFKRSLHKNSFNFLKIDVANSNKIHIQDNYEFVANPIKINKNSKKRLVLLIMLDGYGNYFKNFLPNTNKFFKNSFTNVWSNAEWTLPSYSNLITGQRTSRHKCYKNLSHYSNYFNLSNLNGLVNIKTKNIFEYFKDLGFITSCFSPYVRINPTYNFHHGVDIFKHCQFNTAEQILENVISQLEFFKDGSNFIFAHLFDTHSPAKNIMEISEFVNHPEKNYNFKVDEQANGTHLKKAVKVKNEYESIDRISAFKNTDRKLKVIYDYLDKSNFEDYTILLFGDHGTRINSQMSNTNILSKNQNHIGFHIKDKKVKNFKNKDKIIETIDFLPSLLSRYKHPKYSTKWFDGANYIFSNSIKEFSISESVYEPFYQFNIRSKNINILNKYNFKKDKILNLKSEKIFDSRDKEILNVDKISKKELNYIMNVKKALIKNNNLK